MKRFFRFICAAALFAVLLTAACFAAQVLPTDVTAARSGCTLVGVPGCYIVDAQAALDRINEIRYEACLEGVINPDDGQPLTLDDYVPMKWSSALEYTARIRSAEAIVTGGHVRTNGTSIFTLLQSRSGTGENLAWGNGSMVGGVNLWYEEKDDWVNKTGGVTGHYTAMISPNNRYVGMGCFYLYWNTEYNCYYTCAAANFSTVRSGLDETMGTEAVDIIQTVEMLNSNLGDYLIEDYEDEVLLFVETLGNNFTSSDGCTSQCGSSQVLELQVLDAVSWKSSDTSVIKVNSAGKITRVGCGTATITAYLNGSPAAETELTVEHTPVTDPAVAATCTKAGKTAGSHCSVCGKVLTAQTTVPKTAHSYTMTATGTAGVVRYTCSVCGYSYTAAQALPESEHNYANDTDKTYSYILSGAASLQVTFSSDTKAENNYDFIYILDGSGNQVGKYTGTELAGVTVTVPGDTVQIRLKTDKSGTAYGFRVTKITAGTSSGSSLNGWQKQNGSWYYYTNGTRATGWKKVSNTWYYFNTDGVMQTGWLKAGGTWYYLKPGGAMATGWVRVGSTWYYMNASGAMMTGWVKSGGTWYYLKSSGAMATGWVKVGNTWYYMNASGAMQTGWLKLGSYWYYLQSSGAMACNCTLNIGGTNSRFDASGRWLGYVS